MSFKITILGSSGAAPAYGRMPSSQLIEVQNHYFLIDCGEGTQMQLMKYNLHLHRIDHIFISHLHGDHYLGLMGLLFTLHLNRRATDLHLYSHKGLDEIIITQLKHSNSTLNYKIVFHTLSPWAREVIYDDKYLTVETIPLSHKIICSGFLIREKQKPKRIDKTVLPEGMPYHYLQILKSGNDVLDESGNVLYKNEMYTLPPKKSRSYAYCSDTQYFEKIIPQIKEVDLLYHEATFTSEDQQKAIETKHSTAAEASRIASKANVSKLLIGHFSARYKDLNLLLKEAQDNFNNTILAIEGETYTINE